MVKISDSSLQDEQAKIALDNSYDANILVIAQKSYRALKKYTAEMEFHTRLKKIAPKLANIANKLVKKNDLKSGERLTIAQCEISITRKDTRDNKQYYTKILDYKLSCICNYVPPITSPSPMAKLKQYILTSGIHDKTTWFQGSENREISKFNAREIYDCVIDDANNRRMSERITMLNTLEKTVIAYYKSKNMAKS